MNRIVEYIRTHKLTSILIVVVFYLVTNMMLGNLLLMPVRSTVEYAPGYKSVPSRSPQLSFDGSTGYETGTLSYPVTAPDRKVVINSNFSLLVKDVSDSIDLIRSRVTSVSGYVVDVSVYRGTGSETANLTLRVPNKSVDDLSAYLRSVSVKVVPQHVSGTDVTDQYTDIEGRITELQDVKNKLNQIMNSATTSDEMLRVYNQISSINSQIDSYKGQLKYLDVTSSTSLIIVSLSTDELALPYAPDQPWRPEVVFKSAVRSLLTTLQGIGSLLIWTAVYVPLVGVTLLAIYVIRTYRNKKKKILKP